MKYKENIKKLIALFFLLLGFKICLFSQLNPFAGIVPVSPEVASLGKFGDIPVGNYTGVPDITIPIFNVKQGTLDLPISLSYHAAGIKVVERASWVGLGWALNTGGLISRSIRGIADEMSSTGYLNNSITIPSGITFNDRYNAARGNLDLEPDLYYFSFLGYSGSFEMDRTGKTFITPYKNILIEGLKTQNGYQNNSVGPWRVTLDNGVVLILGSSETEISKDETPTLFSIHGGTTAWFVDEIISADKKDTIYFDYTDISYDFPLTSSSSLYEDLGSVGCTSCSGGSGTVYSGGTDEVELEQYHTKQLNKIRFRGGSITFLAANATTCNTTVPQSILQEIDIADPSGSIVKKFTLNYSTYDPVNKTYLPSNQGNCNNIDDLDIFLTNIQENNNPPYLINYNLDIGMPKKSSAQQDHWGYYNGSGITTLIPNPIQVTSTRYTIGSGRDVNFNYAKQGTIKQITYPTGGYTKFTFEPNDVDADDAKNQVFLNQTFRTASVPSNAFQVDYGWVNHVLTTLTFNQPYLGSTAVTFTMTNFQQTSHSTVSLVSTTNPNAQPIVISFSFLGNNFWSSTTNIPNGTYNLTANFNASGTDATTGSTYQLNMNGYINAYLLSNVPLDINGFRTAIVGGLRIQKVETFDPNTNTTLTKAYTYKHGFNGKSSGKLVWAINYDHVGKLYNCTSMDQGHFGYAQGKYDILNASSNYPLGLTQGSPVGYSEVLVKETSNGKDNGYEDCFYSTPADYPDQRTNPVFQQTGFFYDLATVAPNCCTGVTGVSSDVNSGIFQYPFAPPISFDFARGQLVEEDIYKNTNVISSPYQLIQSTHNNYGIIDFSEALTGEKVGLTFDSYVGDGFSGFYPYSVPVASCAAPWIEEQFSDYDFRKYDLVLNSKDVKRYDANNNVNEIITNYNYNTQLYEPSLITTTTSKGEILETNLKYPLDYSITGTPSNDIATGIQNLQSLHIINPVIEQYVQRSDASGSNFKTISGSLTTYKPTDPYPDIVYNLETIQPIINYQPVSITSSVVTMNSNYKPYLYFDQYDNFGNIIQRHKTTDITYSYIWDYNNSLPIAEVTNSLSSKTAYTSFEADGNGNWSIGSPIRLSGGVTGNNYYQLSNGAISKNQLTPGKQYIVSYWTQNANPLTTITNASVGVKGRTYGTWTYYQHIVSLPVNTFTINLQPMNATIDELRLYPVNAQMTTFTYQPLIGMTSQCDANNKITTYEYDGFSRLQLVRDQDGNILKKYQYAYQSPNPSNAAACDDDGSDGTSNCNGVDEQCVGGFCQKAKRINTSTTLVTSGSHIHQWKCRYYYLWSDGSTKPANIIITDANGNQTLDPSIPPLTEYNDSPCDVQPQ